MSIALSPMILVVQSLGRILLDHRCNHPVESL